MIKSNDLNNRVECLFRSFCLAFINSRGEYYKRVMWKNEMKSLQKKYFITKEVAYEWFRKTLRIFERRENEKLKEKYLGNLYQFSLGFQKPAFVLN